MLNKISEYQKELAQCFNELQPDKLRQIVVQLLKRGRTIFICGNGGSASTANHMEIDLTKGTQIAGGHRLRVISLSNNPAVITAWANDVNFENIFVEPLKNLMMYQDILIGISASGNSPNILSAIKYAKKNGAFTIGFIGFGGGELKNLVDIDITVSSRNYGVVEDFHLSLNHILSQFIKQHLENGERWNQLSL